jgi:hypothetical protein
LQRTVILSLDEDFPAESLEISSLVPGIEVASRRTQGNHIALLVNIDSQRLAQGRHVAVRARSHDGEEQEDLIVQCGPGT